MRLPVSRSRWLVGGCAVALGLAAAIALVAVPAFPAAPAHASVTELLEALRVAIPQEPVEAPELKLTGVDGHAVDLADLRGKLVFLNFWATWCVPCRREMPAMERLHRAYRERGLVVVAVNYKESTREVQAFLEELGLTFVVPLDPKGTVTRTFGVRALPVTYLVDRDGKILWKAQGRRDWDAPHGRAYFERVLAASPR